MTYLARVRAQYQPPNIWLPVGGSGGRLLWVIESDIVDYYRRGSEHRRLSSGHGRWEFLRTWDILARVLPPAPALVLDVGGATGVYAEPLAAAGYRVLLVDPVPEHVAVAATRPGVTAVVGDARRLPAADRAAEVVLLLGPLYHLLERPDRVAAWREAARVVCPGGVVVAASISRFATFLDGVASSFFENPAYAPLVEHALTTGVHRNTNSEHDWFTDAYFHHPDEVAGEVSEAGLVVDRQVSVEGPIWMARQQIAALLADQRHVDLLLDMARTIEEERTLIGASSHFLTVARLPV